MSECNASLLHAYKQILLKQHNYFLISDADILLNYPCSYTLITVVKSDCIKWCSLPYTLVAIPLNNMRNHFIYHTRTLHCSRGQLVYGRYYNFIVQFVTCYYDFPYTDTPDS